jgi:opacity protein-like surface antigen
VINKKLIAVVLSAAMMDASAGWSSETKEEAQPAAVSEHHNTKWHPVIGFSYGATRVAPFSTQTNSAGLQSYTYAPDAIKVKPSVMGLFFGAERYLSSHWMVQAGFGLYRNAAFDTSGTLTQGIDVESADSYTYNYSIASSRLLMEGKLLCTLGKRVKPFILLGLGPAFNKAYNFSTSVSPSLSSTRNYADQTTLSLSYVLGLGMDVDVASFLRVGLTYRYINLGNATLGQSTIDTSSFSTTLNQAHMRASEILLQFTGILN